MLERSEDSECEYEFDFLTPEEASQNDNSHYWFMVGDICDFANETLSKLYDVIHVSPTICYYLEDGAELDKVLNIFIQVNSGGTTLSYSDLLLSFATAQWDKLADGALKPIREIIRNHSMDRRFPSHALISVMSVMYFFNGASEWNSRFSRFSAFMTFRSGFVIPFGFLLGRWMRPICSMTHPAVKYNFPYNPAVLCFQSRKIILWFLLTSDGWR